MKTALAVLVVLIACLLAVDCYGQSTSRFQSVGGDFGRNVIGTLKANDTQPAAQAVIIALTACGTGETRPKEA